MRPPDRHPQHCMDDTCIQPWEYMCVVSREDVDICGWRGCEGHACEDHSEIVGQVVSFIDIIAA